MGADRSDSSSEYFYRFILNPFSTVAWLMRLVGIGFLFSGVTDLITTVYVSKKASEYYVDGKAEEMDEKIK